MTENGASDWPPPREASLLDVLLAALSRLESIGITPWNIWVEPSRKVLVTLSEPVPHELLQKLVAVLAPLQVEPHWYEVLTERVGAGSGPDDDDGDAEPPDACSVCGRPGPLREYRLDPSAQPKGGGLAIASIWHVCSDCLATIARADPDDLKSRLLPEDQAAPYVDVLVKGLLNGIALDS